jgi:hypothetical protein
MRLFVFLILAATLSSHGIQRLNFDPVFHKKHIVLPYQHKLSEHVGAYSFRLPNAQNPNHINDLKQLSRSEFKISTIFTHKQDSVSQNEPKYLLNVTN